MRNCFLYLCLCFSLLGFSQNITTDIQTYTPQQLIEDILIDSDCISNIQVTNVVGGDFGGSDESYGYFNANGSGFPFDEGLVLTTGRMQNVAGPNSTLSDDDAPNWGGDADLEEVLNEPNTLNATILEFNFTAVASQVSFRYIFASEEYQANNPNSCNYSDLFGFLIRPVNEQEFLNIALVPNTDTPVKATTVHPEIPNGCAAQNEAYFGSYNPTTWPINFNGQTAILTATANVIPNNTYHVKLVIADEQNYRYDSAVFLEAGSFELTTDMGPDRLLGLNNALCEGENLWLDATENQATSYLWKKDGVLLPDVTSPIYNVESPGLYEVEITLDNDCISYGSIAIEYSETPLVQDANLSNCDSNNDGLSFYDLYDAENQLTINDSNLIVGNFFLTETDAINNTNPLENPNNFGNTTPNQLVYARIINNQGCASTASVRLETSNTNIFIPALEICDDETVDGFVTFNLQLIEESIEAEIPETAEVNYYLTENDAIFEENQLPNNYLNVSPFLQTIFVRIQEDGSCLGINEVDLKVLYTPQNSGDSSTIYCNNLYPDTIRLYGGVLNDLPNNYYYNWLFNNQDTEVDTSFIDINEPGVYTVIITDPNGCSSQRNITVIPADAPVISGITYLDTPNSILVETLGNGPFQYAIDDINGSYQSDPNFYNLDSGFHTVYVKDEFNCNTASMEFAIVGYPKFFTPNGDNYNELWQLKGVNAEFNSELTVKIFNRYGKLITNLSYNDVGWNGTLNGNLLPSDDYWFVVYSNDQIIYRGHFALVR
ncbi:MAG: hypothetical protein BM564_05290 [Bacteroidetes bacterium MedPE-SWsnd-G2]|nr:MAG: hypothetical protein BM564_05290 [Bacteroidetes bacterium MedPE-SWsnd-G2]